MLPVDYAPYPCRKVANFAHEENVAAAALLALFLPLLGLLADVLG